MCQGPKKVRDPGSPGSRVRDLGRILDLIFSFAYGILEILNPGAASLPWDTRDLGSRTEEILLDPGDPGSRLSRLSWDLADLGSYRTIMSLYFEHPLHPMKFCSVSPFLCAA